MSAQLYERKLPGNLNRHIMDMQIHIALCLDCGSDYLKSRFFPTN